MISKAKKSHSGEYECTANNAAGSDFATLKIQVNGKLYGKYFSLHKCVMSSELHIVVGVASTLCQFPHVRTSISFIFTPV